MIDQQSNSEDKITKDQIHPILSTQGLHCGCVVPRKSMCWYSSRFQLLFFLSTNGCLLSLHHHHYLPWLPPLLHLFIPHPPMMKLVQIARLRAVMSKAAPTTTLLLIQHIKPSPKSLSHQLWHRLKTSLLRIGAYRLHPQAISCKAGISQMSACSLVRRKKWVPQLQGPIWFPRQLSLKM